MEYINEFIPIELIKVNDIEDVPNEYLKFIKAWLKLKYGFDDEESEKYWAYGDEIRICHWEWCYNKEYFLVIDISGFPEGQENGFVCFNNEIVFDNDCLVLTSINKNSMLNKRLHTFEHARTIDCDEHDHCNHIYELYQELEEDLSEESVDEEEYKINVTEPYIHYSSDDASDVDSDEFDG